MLLHASVVYIKLRNLGVSYALWLIVFSFFCEDAQYKNKVQRTILFFALLEGRKPVSVGDGNAVALDPN